MKDLTLNDKSQKITKNEKDGSIKNNQMVKPLTARHISDASTIIRWSLGITAVIVCGIIIGIFIRYWREPQWLTYSFPENFKVQLPFRPERREMNGVPPFSNRRIIAYHAAVTDAAEYTMLVLEPPTGGVATTGAATILSPTLPKMSVADFGDADLLNWSETTVAVLCADEAGAIDHTCLQSGSRVNEWTVRQPNGRIVRGRAGRASGGRIVQLLAAGVDDQKADKFLNSLSHKTSE